ncbi:LPS export ABC transporter periplasmic protein LptC [Candidatus Marinamargulisbacteria bacterium SCGC AG-414-C22]|nr:LPS export ABC transporter periplasmic protein LptC [Candidatus Marinamargulisbacteria bacterium SCGC AG-414-C22]
MEGYIQNMNSTILNRLVFYFFVLIVGVVIMMTFSIKPKKIDTSNVKKNVPDFEFKHVHIYHVDNGNIIFDLEAEGAKIFRDKESYELKNIIGNVYKKSEPLLIIAAAEGDFNIKKSELNLNQTQSFFLKKDNPILMIMNNLLWNSQEELVKGRGDVSIYQEKYHISADQIIVDLGASQIDLMGNITSKINSEILQ